MTDKKWDDKQIEELLDNIPDAPDNRSKSDILARLKQDERLNAPRQRKQKRWIPALVAVAALLVIGLLLPSMLRQNEGAMTQDAVNHKTEESEATDRESGEDSGESAVFNETIEMEEATPFAATSTEVSSHVVLPTEQDGMHTFRVGLVHAAEVIPITFLIPNDRIENDFPEKEPDSLELYNQYAAGIPEPDFGFDDYHPFKGKLTLKDNVIEHAIPAEHPYDMSSATERIYADAVLETFTDHPTFITVDENGNPAEFSHTGVTGPVKLLDGKRPMPYYKYTMPSGEFYLVPAGGRVYDTVGNALAGMKVRQGDIFESVIPESVTYTVREENGHIFITFKDQLDLSILDPVEATAMIEGFMLTASNFNQQVQLENVVQEQFGKYDLTTVLPEPIGVNPLFLPE